MCSELTPRARIPDTRIPQLMQPCTQIFWWKVIWTKSKRTAAFFGKPSLIGYLVEQLGFIEKLLIEKRIQIKDFVMSRIVFIACFPWNHIYCSRKSWSVLLKVIAQGSGNILFNFEDETNIVILSWSLCWPPSLPACCPLIPCGMQGLLCRLLPWASPKGGAYALFHTGLFSTMRCIIFDLDNL